MSFLFDYNEGIVKYDFINKFNYKHMTKIPKLKSLTLSFKLRKYDFKSLITALAAIEIMTFQKSVLNRSRVSNISLKIRQGQPIGCKVTLRKKKFYQFLIFLINNTKVTKRKIKKKNVKYFFSLTIQNILTFNVLEKNYLFFKNLSDLNISLTTTNCGNKELSFLLISNKLVL